MRTVYVVLIIVVTILLIAFIYALNEGLFKKVTVEEREEGGFIVAGMEYTGAYKDAGKFMSDVDKKLKDAGIVCSKGFGIYYDDPKTTPAEKCRSYVGGILEEKDLDKIVMLSAKGIKVDTVPKKMAAIVEFPIKSKASYMVGPMKAYPAISKYMKEKSYRPSLSLEIYDADAKKISYVMQFNR